jgi:hypothetical protein
MPNTTLNISFEICKNDDFARPLLSSKMPQYYTLNQLLKKFQEPVTNYLLVFSTDTLGHTLGRI